MSLKKHTTYEQAFRREVDLLLVGCLGRGERGHLVAVPKGALNGIVKIVHAEAASNRHRLKEYSAELMQGAEALMRTDELDDDGVLQLAVTLIALHGPAGRTASLLRNAHKCAGTVEIDRNANAIRYGSVPIAEILGWATIDPVIRH